MKPTECRYSLSRSVPILLLSTALVCTSCIQQPPSAQAEAPETMIDLDKGWTLAAMSTTDATGEQISKLDYDDSAWLPTTVPTTILAAQVAAGEIEDPYFGRNFETIDPEPFAGPWWYRTVFTHPGPPEAHTRLVLEGVNYSAEVWLNGRQVAGRDEVFGAFRLFDLEIGSALAPGDNSLAIAVYPPEPGDPTIGFVDWNPEPPDRNMGLWRPVKLRLTGDISVDELFVESDLDTETLERASLTLSAKLTNFADHPVQTTVRAAIDDTLTVEQTLEMQAGEQRRVVFAPTEFAALDIEAPRVWWPNNMGEPHLYDLEMSATIDDRVSDFRRDTFGIRKIEDYFNEEGHRGYIVNGEKTLIRGGGWVDDLMLADDSHKIEDQMRYARHMNLNTIRLEGFWGSSQELFDLADRYGLLVMVGWSCQWEWEEYLGGPVDEFGGISTPEHIDLVARSLRDQVTWLRNHPSVFVWVLASDMLPRPALESRYLEVLEGVDTTRPALAACAVATSDVSGPTGVKMNGPYDYVPPSYWYLDTKNGGAYGFNTETGPGPQPPPIESIQRMMPEENWWPIDDMWNYHSGRHTFNTIDNYREALDRRYGEATNLEDFSRKAQVANYEAMRAMFEAFSVRRPVATGVIQWMLNSAWPELYWQLYDHYLIPNGAFYGARNANRPVNMIFDYGDRSIVVVNDTGEDRSGFEARVQVLDLRSNPLFEESQAVDLAAESRKTVLSLPPIKADDGVYFLDLRLLDPAGEVVTSSLYWLPTKEDQLDWEATEWYYTPISEFADMTALVSMPEATLEVEHSIASDEQGETVMVNLSNTGDQMAFFVELQILGAGSGNWLTPVIWDDNYLSLLPGERRTIRGWVPRHALGNDSAAFHYSGWNVAAK